MDASSQRKRKFATPCINSKKRRTSITPKAVKKSMHNNLNVKSRTTKNSEKRCPNSPTQNNRELATALSKARSRIRELEDQRFGLQGDQQDLMEKYNALKRQLQKMKEEHVAKQDIDSKILKEICEALRSSVQKATKKLLESSVFLSEMDQSVTTLLSMASSQDSVNRNRSAQFGLPLEIMLDDDSTQKSQEAALSITKLTPSPSSASSSDSCDMTSPESCASSTPLPNQPGLLTTKEDHHSMHEISDVHQILSSSQNSGIEIEVLNASQESMDCHNNCDDPDILHTGPGLMDVDSSTSNSDKESPALSSTPDCSPIRYVRSVVRRLASTPEDCEISRFAANLSADSPQLSPVINLCNGKRALRRRNTIDGFCGYKEPSLNSKLRQGDPFTDCSFFNPSSKNKFSKKKQTQRR